MEIKNEQLVKEEESTTASAEVALSALDQKIIRQVEVNESGCDPARENSNHMLLHSTTSVITTFPVTPF